jgi:hypothetical protein
VKVNRDIEKAMSFHELTKHSYISVRATAHWLDWPTISL